MTLPEGWVETTIGELGRWEGGGTPAKSNSTYWTDGSIPWVSPKDMKRPLIGEAEDYITKAAIEGSSTNLITTGAILLVTRSGILRHTLPVAETIAPVAINQDLKALSPAEGIVTAFIRHAFLAFGPDILHSCAKAGTTVDSIDFERLRVRPIPLPPAAEQRRIVAKLEALTARLAHARADLDRVPVLVERLREKVLERAASGALLGLPDIHARPCEDWIESTFYGPRFSKDDYVAEGIPTARTTDFNSNGTMSIDDAPKVAVSDKDYGRWGCLDGDLLVTRTGSIGKCAIYRETYGQVLPSAYLIRVRFDGRLDPRFAWMMFASPIGQKHLGLNSKAVTQPNINASAIRSFSIPDLTIEQQVETVKIVDRALARADRMEAEAVRARALIDRLEAAILGRAFRGELVPQDPNDEPASVLLDRIRAQRAAAPKPKRGRRKQAQ